MSKFFSKTSNLMISLVLFAFACLSIMILAANAAHFIDLFSGNKLLLIVSAFVLVIFVALIILLWEKISCLLLKLKEAINKISVKKMIVIIVITSLISKIAAVLIFRIDSSQHPDCAVYWSFIKQLNDGGVITDNAQYAFNFTYTLIYSTFFLPIAKLFGTNSILLFNVYLSVLLTISAYLVFDLVKYYKGKNIAFVSSMLWVLFPYGIVEPLLLVHENSFVFFHSLVIWIWFRLIPTIIHKYLKVIAFIISVIIISYATIINTFGLFSILSYCFVLFVLLLKYKLHFKNLFTLILAIALLFGGYFGAKEFKDSFRDKVVDMSNVNISFSEKALPYGWGIYVGLNYESKGTWTDKDRDTYYLYINMSKEDALKYQKTLIRERAQFYLDNPIRIVKHIIDIFEMVWTNSFNPIGYNCGGKVNSFILEWKGGVIHSIIIRIIAFINFILSFVLALSIKKNKKYSSINSYVLYIITFLLVATLPFMLHEVTPKYSSHFMFLYFIMVANNINSFISNMDSIHNKLFVKNIKGQ